MTATRHPTRTFHEYDDPEKAKLAIAAGWYLDDDDWWVRTIKAGDPEIPGTSTQGFTEGTEVYVRDAGQALAYDRGVTP